MSEFYEKKGIKRKFSNRVLVVKPHNKTPYELFRGRTPALSFMRPFRVYNIRTRKVEENLHVRFLEDKPIIAGTNSNDFVGTKESNGADHSRKEPGSSQDYILMPLWKDGLLFDSFLKDASNNEPQPSNDVEKKDDEVPTTPLESTYANFFSDESELDLSNIATTYPVPTTPNTRIDKDYSLNHVLGDVQSGV
ncbi:hypothetical protein Tco_0043130 [Tanacetum coccineum]